MKRIFSELASFFRELEQRVFACATFLVAIAIFINYYFGLNDRISIMKDPSQILSWYMVFLFVFASVYFFIVIFTGKKLYRSAKFIALLLIAPAIFAWKMAGTISLNITGDPTMNAYWNAVIYWPGKLLVVFTILMVLWKLLDKKEEIFGLKARNFSPGIYFTMLAIMIPLIGLASTQEDFLAVYPKLKNIGYLPTSGLKPLYQILYEFSYGIDFITIEMFFRGFLVLAFAKFAGKDAILPMAVFYCTIHFGKPLGECISSYFGGILLGVVTYHTRNIYGGLIVHLGIAWMMELGGAIGNYFQ